MIQIPETMESMKSSRLKNEHDDDIMENSCLQMIHTPTIEINQSMSMHDSQPNGKLHNTALACDAARQCPGDRIIIAYFFFACLAAGKRSMR